MKIEIAAILFLIAAAAIILYHLFCVKWNWGRVLGYITLCFFVVLAFTILDNYRIFMIAVVAIALLEFKYFSRR
jgi:hypothetical protein